MIHYHAVPRVVRFRDMESRMAIARDLGSEELLNGHGVSVREDEKVLKMDGSDGCTTV